MIFSPLLKINDVKNVLLFFVVFIYSINLGRWKKRGKAMKVLEQDCYSSIQ